MAKTIELYWDIGSTNTYFALKLIGPIAARHDAELVLHPFNLGHVFRHHDYVLMDEPAAKIANRKRDLARWAEKYDLPFRFPDRFPIKTSRALRGAIAMRRWDKEGAFVDAIFRRYWEANDAGIADYAGLRVVAGELGVDGDAFEAACESEDVRQALIEATDDGLARGVFGAPSFVVGGEIYWGKDRMDFIEDALARTG
jgi:2-hydroxychromene-2-carboxylate isomerase